MKKLIFNAIVFCEMAQAVGRVKDPENNIVSINGEDVTIDPEFQHDATEEEIADWKEDGHTIDAEFELPAENDADEVEEVEENNADLAPNAELVSEVSDPVKEETLTSEEA